MRHAFRIDGPAYCLRSAELSDCPFILSVRTDPELARYLGDSAQSLEQQTAWMEAYFARDLDYYFIIQRLSDGKPEGTIGVYDVSPAPNERRAAEWGRWILKRGSWAAIESTYLIYRFAFEVLKLDELYCRTVAQNASVISFHESCGLPSGRLLPEHFTLRGKAIDAVEHRLKAEAWPSIGNDLRQRAAKIAQRLSRPSGGAA